MILINSKQRAGFADLDDGSEVVLRQSVFIRAHTISQIFLKRCPAKS
jgi:hypothetical protein